MVLLSFVDEEKGKAAARMSIDQLVALD